MKCFVLFVLALMTSQVFSQVEVKNGIPIEYNELKDVTFKIYKPALRINRAIKQSDVDYTQVEGLVQSYFSATDSIWDKSDYLDKTHETVKDMEHYNSIKKSNIEKEYVEIESVFEFVHNGQQMSYVKYAITMDGVPFQVVTTLSCVKKNNRWYIDNFFNQSNILSLLSKLNSDKLNLIFSAETPKNEIILNIQKKSSQNGVIDINYLYDLYSNELKNNNSATLKEIRDERDWVENYHYPTAEFNVKPTIYKFKIFMPFSLDNANFYTYNKEENTLTSNSKLSKNLSQNLEGSLLTNSNDIITLVHKFYFNYDNQKVTIIKYKLNNKIEVVYFNNDIKTNNINIPVSFKYIFLNVKSKYIEELFSDTPATKEVYSLRKKAISKTEEMINLSELYYILMKDKQNYKSLLEN